MPPTAVAPNPSPTAVAHPPRTAAAKHTAEVAKQSAEPQPRSTQPPNRGPSQPHRRGSLAVGQNRTAEPLHRRSSAAGKVFRVSCSLHADGVPKEGLRIPDVLVRIAELLLVRDKKNQVAGGASLSLTCIASERIIPGYGGGMSSAKSALESDTRVLAFEAGRKHKVRVNTNTQFLQRKILSGPLRSRAAKAIGFIDMMIDYSIENAPLQKELSAEEVGNAAAFLASPLASAIMGAVVYVDNGLNAMRVGVDSPVFKDLDNPKDKSHETVKQAVSV
nr:enoyl-[acyl-carrier-protein] reductase [NADH], chloroplastic-like [Ipomoea batatas]